MTGISPERQAAMFARFAEGATTRQVAVEFGIGNGTAARALQRFREQQDPAQSQPEPDPVIGSELTLTGLPVPDFAARLAELGQLQARIADVVSTHEERAQASRTAVAALEAERLEVLARGGDAQPLRQRRRDAEDDLADSEKAAELAREQLAEAGQQIAEVTARQELARARAGLGIAVAARDAVYARSGARQQAAVAAVWAAAEDFAAVPADELAADSTVAQALSAAAGLCQQLGEPLPSVPPAAPSWMPVPGGAPGGPELALTRAMFQARRGDVAAVATLLGEARGWTPPPPPDAAELARMRELAEQRQRQADRERAKSTAGIGYQEPGSVTDMDQLGRPLWPDPPELRRSPTDAYPGTPPTGAFGHAIRGW